jgi:hypothetical protein
MLPVTLSGKCGLEFDSGEFPEAIGLVFDCHGEDFGMLDKVALRARWRRSDSGSRRLVVKLSAAGWRETAGRIRALVKELSAVVEQIKVLNHQFDNLRVVADIRAVVVILCCCQLDDPGLSLLPLAGVGLGGVEVGCLTLNVPLLRAVSKYTYWLQITALCASNVYDPHTILQSECFEDL